MVFISKLDRDRADYEGTLDQLRDRFGAGIAPLELPIGAEADFRGVADLLSDTAYVYAGGVATHEEVPPTWRSSSTASTTTSSRASWSPTTPSSSATSTATCPSVEELERTLAVGVDEASVFPVVCGSATGEVAVDRLADFICEIGPSPADRPPVEVAAGDTTVEVGARPRRPDRSCSCSRRSPTSSSATCRSSGCCRAPCAPTTTW